MKLKEPKNTDKIYWTEHSKEKMKFYGLSEARLKRILRHPQREEKGVAPRTAAVMQKAGTKKRPTEIWLMYQIAKNKEKIIVISAWRYPGISPMGEPPIPEDVLKYLPRTSESFGLQVGDE